MPAPLTPTMPTRSPGPSRQVAWSRSWRSPAEEVDVLDVDDVLAEPLGGEALELHPVAWRRDVLDQLVGGVDAELGLGRAGRSAAAQPGELLLDEVLPAHLRRGRLPLALGLGQHERGVPALVAVDGAVVDLPRRLADLVEEPPVVGDDDEGAGAADEVLGQPRDRLDVEVVGRLVEHDEVVAPEQQRGQRAAPALAAGEARARHGPARCRPAAPRRCRAWWSRRPTRGRSGRPAPPRAPSGCRPARRPGGGSRSRRRGSSTPGPSRAPRDRSSPRAAWSCRRRCDRRCRSAPPPRRRARRRRAAGGRRTTWRPARG